MANKRIIRREVAVEALASVCEDYRGTALRAVREGRENVYIPADIRNVESLLECLRTATVDMFQAGDSNEKEPCYASLEEFLQGRNTDGTPHRGIFLIDVVAKVITDIRDRNYTSIVPEVLPLSPAALINELQGRPRSYCL